MVHRILAEDERLVEAGSIGYRQYPGGPVVRTEPIYIIEKVSKLTENGLTPKQEKNYDQIMKDLSAGFTEYARKVGFGK